MIDHAAPRSGNRQTRWRTTMLELVQSLTREGLSEHEIVVQVLDRVESGQVILIGSFRDTPLRESDEAPLDVKSVGRSGDAPRTRPDGVETSRTAGQRSQ